MPGLVVGTIARAARFAAAGNIVVVVILEIKGAGSNQISGFETFMLGSHSLIMVCIGMPACKQQCLPNTDAWASFPRPSVAVLYCSFISPSSLQEEMYLSLVLCRLCLFGRASLVGT